MKIQYKTSFKGNYMSRPNSKSKRIRQKDKLPLKETLQEDKVPPRKIEEFKIPTWYHVVLLGFAAAVVLLTPFDCLSVYLIILSVIYLGGLLK